MNKETKLREFAKGVIEHSEYKAEIKKILGKLGITEEEAIQDYVNYDLDVNAYSNEIYESLGMRMVLHLHNLLERSWHQERQQTILEMLSGLENVKSIVDMGFGVPIRYVKEYVLKNKNLKLTLVDMYDSAFDFSRVLLDSWSENWRDQIEFKKLDMNSHEYVGDFDVYIFQDSIEHVEKATEYLSKTVKLAPKSAKFVLSLPIGPKVPSHFISWKTGQEAGEWLKKCGLTFGRSKKVYVNRDVDLFADNLGGLFYNWIVECERT